MNGLILVMRAARLAAQCHIHQRRKGQSGEPYVNHLLEVASLVTQATNGSEPSVTIAALLHDAIEDQNVKSETIAQEFGQHVADVVLELTDDKSLPEVERRRLQVEHAPHMSREAKLIKLADKISNVLEIADSPPPNWTTKRRLEYIQWGRDVVAGLHSTSPWLETQFDDAAQRAEASLGQLSPSGQLGSQTRISFCPHPTPKNDVKAIPPASSSSATQMAWCRAAAANARTSSPR